MNVNEPTEAQIKEFWEWCGIDITRLPCPIIECARERSDYCKTCHVIIPPIDLNNLFEYAVPQTLNIIQKKYCPPIMKLFQLWYDKLVSLTGDSSNTKYANVALFWIIWEIIKDETAQISK